MKHKKVLFIGFTVVLLVIAVITLMMIFGSGKDKELDIKLYFLNPVSNEIVAENRKIEKNNESEMLENVILDLELGPKNTASLVNAIPEGVQFKECKLVKGDSTAYLTIKDDNNELKDSKALLFKGAVVWSLTELEFVDNVVLEINGKESEVLNRDNVIINPVISPDKTEKAEVTLYFSDEMAMGLCSEKRVIEVNQNQTIENQIVEQLIKGPENSKLYQTVPSETKIKNIKTEESICYVDLSKEFVTKHSGGSTSEMLTIYSIVNSLTELDNVTKVQFLIEGQKEDMFKGHLDFSKPFERNEEIIQNN